MSKIGQYIVGRADYLVDDDPYWQSHEYGEDYKESIATVRAWYDLTKLPPDIKEKLADCGIDDYLLDDDLPF